MSKSKALIDILQPGYYFAYYPDSVPVDLIAYESMTYTAMLSRTLRNTQ